MEIPFHACRTGKSRNRFHTLIQPVTSDYDLQYTSYLQLEILSSLLSQQATAYLVTTTRWPCFWGIRTQRHSAVRINTEFTLDYVGMGKRISYVGRRNEVKVPMYYGSN